MSTKNGAAAPPPPAIATKAELDLLTANRPEPISETHLRPNAPQATDVHEQVNAMMEKRIGNLQERLQRARQGIETDHAFAQIQDRAGADFERSR